MENDALQQIKEFKQKETERETHVAPRKQGIQIGKSINSDFFSIKINKSRDITLPTKTCLVKAMIFPVIMYGCESWTIKK